MTNGELEERLAHMPEPILAPAGTGHGDVLRAGPTTSLFLVSGPGTGKTAAIAARVLRLLLVDGVTPENIVVVTFTRKAAAELQTRILRNYHWVRDPGRPADEVLAPLVNLRISTLDALIQETYQDVRPAGVLPPVMVEDIGKAVLMTRIMLERGAQNSRRLRQYLLSFGRLWPMNLSGLRDRVLEIHARLITDLVEEGPYFADKAAAGVEGAARAQEYIEVYRQVLRDHGLTDFELLAHDFLHRLRDGQLDDWRQDVHHLLVDEYQDTNLLQDEIYLEMVGPALAAQNGSITVVGDDDQSLYRFRGATVEIFTSFPSRVANVGTISLDRNHRSDGNIVSYARNYIANDPQYAPARAPNKSGLVEVRPARIAVYGLFRPNLDQLAEEIARLIRRIGTSGVRLPGLPQPCRLPSPRMWGDMCLISFSANTHTYGGGLRLPGALYEVLSDGSPSVPIFNPRGEGLAQHQSVRLLIGLFVLCLDPTLAVLNNMNAGDVIPRVTAWVQEATAFLSGGPQPRRPRTLQQFVSACQSRATTGGGSWPRELSLLELTYKLATWIPELLGDRQGLLLLEAVVRAVDESARFRDFQGAFVYDTTQPGLEAASTKEALWNVVVPIATGAVKVDDSYVESLPREAFNVLTVHQAKGLQFPVTFVDVGAHFHVPQVHPELRFPNPDSFNVTPYSLEQDVRRFSPLAGATGARSERDRACDDIVRNHFVAASRAQDLMILVGLGDHAGPRSDLRNLAVGCRRDGSDGWNSLNVTLL